MMVKILEDLRAASLVIAILIIQVCIDYTNGDAARKKIVRSWFFFFCRFANQIRKLWCGGHHFSLAWSRTVFIIYVFGFNFNSGVNLESSCYCNWPLHCHLFCFKVSSLINRKNEGLSQVQMKGPCMTVVVLTTSFVMLPRPGNS